MCHHCIANDGISRREFLAGAAVAATAGPMLLRIATASESAKPALLEPQGDWPQIDVVYLRPKEKYWLGWPGTSWEHRVWPTFVQDTGSKLQRFADDLHIRLNVHKQPLYDEGDLNTFVAELKDRKPAGVIVFPLHMNYWGYVDAIAKAGTPTIIFAGLGTCFTGHIQEMAKRPGVHLISSADFDLSPVRYGMKMVRTEHDVRRTRIAVIAGNGGGDQVLDPFGLRIRRLPEDRFINTLNGIGETPDVLAMVDEYKRKAKKVVEPSHKDLVNAARNYYTAEKIMKEEDCDGITMDCLGAVYSRTMPSPPCMAWSRFLDHGIPAICEADVNAVMSHTLCIKLLDKPGFQQDPVPDTVRNTFMGAHCVCATRLNGYNKPSEPFALRSHSESDVGVSVQVFWKVGQEVTLMQFTDPGHMILGKGKVLRNFDTPPAGGCRTSVELAIDGPADTRDTKGFHQLFIYGDHMRDFQAYGQMYGIATEHV